MAKLILLRAEMPFLCLNEVKASAAVSVLTLELLVDADAFASLGLSRREALWALKGQSTERLPLFAAADTLAAQIKGEGDEPIVFLTPMSEAREVVEDYSVNGLSLKRHPLHFVRSSLREKNVITACELQSLKTNYVINVAGIVLVRQRPMTATGVIFMTIEDETGVANLIIWPSLFERQRSEVMSAKLLVCKGIVQKEGAVIHVIAKQLIPLRNFCRRKERKAIKCRTESILLKTLKVPHVISINLRFSRKRNSFPRRRLIA